MMRSERERRRRRRSSPVRERGELTFSLPLPLPLHLHPSIHLSNHPSLSAVLFHQLRAELCKRFVLTEAQLDTFFGAKDNLK
eukprot:3268882-Rhodomonas_salina.1